MPQPTLHHLLQYTLHAPHDGATRLTSSLLWDVRSPARSASHISIPTRPLSDFELSQHATDPPVAFLRITCGIFPESFHWVSEARNWLGVTIKNVLDAIYATLDAQITYPEWDELCPKQQNRVNLVFDARWRASVDVEPSRVRSQGVLRADCLLQRTLFAGLSNAPDSEDTFLLTLRRPRR